MNIKQHELKEISNINYYLYGLFNRKKLVYVGLSTNLSNSKGSPQKKRRIAGSVTVQKKFDTN